MEELIHQFKIVTDMALPKGESYTGIESSKGELGFLRRVRRHEQTSALSHPRAGLDERAGDPMVSMGRLFSDMVSLIGSLDFVMGEVDR